MTAYRRIPPPSQMAKAVRAPTFATIALLPRQPPRQAPKTVKKVGSKAKPATPMPAVAHDFRHLALTASLAPEQKRPSPSTASKSTLDAALAKVQGRHEETSASPTSFDKALMAAMRR